MEGAIGTGFGQSVFKEFETGAGARGATRTQSDGIAWDVLVNEYPLSSS